MQTRFQRSTRPLRQLCAALATLGLLAGTSVAHADDPYNSSPLINNPASQPVPRVQATTPQPSPAAATAAAVPKAAAAQAVAAAKIEHEAAVIEATQSDAVPNMSTRAASAHQFLSNVADKAGEVVSGALNMIGVRYKWGGNTPDSGLDCSGFVRYVFNDTLGFLLPRRAEEMSRVGERVARNDLQPGDLVFFNTMRRTASHVGIYVGNDKFVHAPATGGKIRVEDLREAYWSRRYDGARRIEQLTGVSDLTRIEQIFKRDRPL